MAIPEYIFSRVLADSGGWVALKTVLARRRGVGTNGVLLLAFGTAISLKRSMG